MPVGGDLGFSYLVLVVVLVVPVIGFLVRRKWRISVARNEEIKRLLVLAKEEAARAELETTFGYAVPPAVTFSRPLQYECAVCFCPTTTRCARCKAVRYCSGKCQIIHWRQGHKEECRPFTTYQSNDAGGGSFQKVLKQEDSEIHGISFESEGRQRAKSVKNFLKEPASSKSGSTPEVFHGNDGTEVEFPADGKDKNVSLHEAERSDGDQPTNIFPDKPMTSSVKNVNQNGPPSSKRTILVDSIDCLTSSGKLNEVKPDYADHNSQCGSTSSSGWSADGSNESSFSEPSTPSSGFWEGNINSSKLKMDALDDCAQSSSGGAGDADLRNSQSSLSCSFKPHGNVIPPLVEQDSGAKTITSDEHCSTTLGIKKPMDRAVLSQEKSADASKGRSSPLVSPKNSDYIDVCMSSDSPVSKSGEPRFYSSGTYVSGRPSISTRASKASSMHSLGPEKSNHLVDDTRSISSSDFIAHPSSSTRRQSLQGENPGKVENAHAIASETANYSPNTKNGLTTSMRKVVDQFRTSKSSRHYQSEVGSEISGRYNNKGLFPYELFVTLYNWNKVELRPFGLTNCGNSCYANAVLQCLACTPPLTAYLLQGLHSKACERKEWCFTCEFESLILKGKEGTSPVSPIGILSQIQNIGSHLGNGREEDAHEFLRYAIDTMQSVCLKEAGVNASRSLEEESTLVGLTFGGYLRSKIKCMKCGGKSERHERMMDLTVEIEGDIGTLEEALRKFTGTEILDGDNKYQCGRCRSYERAKKKLTVLEAPNILTIALKRFQSGKFGKLNKSIQFPEILDLAPYMSRTSDNSPVYRLYGVVVHLDVMNAAFSGHYVCYVKTGQKKWFEIDDSKVKAVELENVLTRRAYMLLYARYSPRAPRFIRNSIIPLDPRRTKNPIFKSRVHPTGPWDALNGHNSIDGFHPIHTNFIRPILEEDSSSDNSSSIFSEECSRSTGSSSNKDSTSADDYDHLFVEPGGNWNTLWKNASDSDSSSSCSSSSPIPSPLHTRHSPIAAESDRTEASGFQTRNAKFDADGNDFWGRLPTRNPVLYSDTAKQCRKLESSSSCRETDSSRLGRANPKADVPFRRPTGKRTD